MIQQGDLLAHASSTCVYKSLSASTCPAVSKQAITSVSLFEKAAAAFTIYPIGQCPFSDGMPLSSQVYSTSWLYSRLRTTSLLLVQKGATSQSAMCPGKLVIHVLLHLHNLLHGMQGTCSCASHHNSNLAAGIELKESTLATHYLPSSRLPELEQAIQGLGSKAAEHSAVHRLICSFEVPAPSS